MKLFFKTLFLALFLSGCGSKSIVQNTEKGSNILENPLALSLEESITLKGTTIKFVEVVEDSRCPTKLDCVWAGRAIVKVEVATDGKKEERSLIFGEVRPGEHKDNTLYVSPEFIVEGINLDPYPHADISSEETAYVLIMHKKEN